MLETKDLRKCIEFYFRVLGFTRSAMHPNEERPMWAGLRRDDVVIMSVARMPRSKIEKPTFTGSLYLYPDNVDDAWEELKDKADVSYEIEMFDFGMREFESKDVDISNSIGDREYGMRGYDIRDPNGYILSFAKHIS